MEMMPKHIHHYKFIYLEYAPLLIRFANKFVSDYYAEDIVQDVFLKLWDKQIFLLPENDIKKILYTAVRNACIDYLRKINLEEEIIEKKAIQLKLEELDYFESSDELFMQKDLLNLLMEKIDSLPERSRQVFRMAYLEGLKSSEIAEKLHISTRTVDNLLYRSLLTLRKESSHLLYLLIFFI